MKDVYFEKNNRGIVVELLKEPSKSSCVSPELWKRILLALEDCNEWAKRRGKVKSLIENAAASMKKGHFSVGTPINGYPSIEEGYLENDFFGVCCNEKLDNVLTALNNWCGAHVDANTKQQIQAIILTSTWNQKEFNKYDRIIRSYLKCLSFNIDIILVTDCGAVRIPFV